MRPTRTNRQGALPLHLMLTMLPWLASNAALQLSRSGWSGSRAAQKLPGIPNALAEAFLPLLENPELAAATEAEARKRAVDFLTGIERYHNAPFTRDVPEPECVWQHGNARLLRYGEGKKNAPAILLIPSLINRYYILDLTQKLSFARYLQAQGYGVYVIDWDTPSEEERHYNCALYVTEVLVPAAEWIRAQNAAPLVLGGYCMGGLLALALACIRPDLADAAAFFATPWNFFSPDFPKVSFEGGELAAIERYINGCDELPAETIHTLFHCVNPYAFQTKLREFAHMDADNPATQEFLTVEHWVNDGVPMTRGVARDCLIEWAQRNTPARNQWHVGGQIINPAKLRMPCFVAAPRDDRIVPKDSALPLAKLLRDCTLIEPQSGHIGMMVGHRRNTALWNPFTQWLKSQFA